MKKLTLSKDNKMWLTSWQLQQLKEHTSHEGDPLYQCIYRAGARALIRYQQKVFEAEFKEAMEHSNPIK